MESGNRIKMSKNNKWNKNKEVEAPEIDSEEYVQNHAPVHVYSSFEEFWYSCVRGNDYFLMESCKAHLKALGWMSNQSKWLDGVRHFGVPVEKDKK